MGWDADDAAVVNRIADALERIEKRALGEQLKDGSRRDFFAAAALQGILCGPGIKGRAELDESGKRGKVIAARAEYAVEHADALIDALAAVKR